MSMFHIGQLVVCVDDRENAYRKFKCTYQGNLDGLAKDAIYTIRGFYNGDNPVWNKGDLYLEEIVRPLEGGREEAPYHYARFRPVVTTDISIFEAMLVPTPKEKVEA